jgi:hypothetical protein
MLGNAGFVFTIPDPCSPGSQTIPTPHEVAPWVATIERLWDDPAFETRHRALAKTEANRCNPALVAGQYQQFCELVIAAAVRSNYGSIADVNPRRTSAA